MNWGSAEDFQGSETTLHNTNGGHIPIYTCANSYKVHH